MPPAGIPVEFERLGFADADARRRLDRERRGDGGRRADFRGDDLAGIGQENAFLFLAVIGEIVEDRVVAGRKKGRAVGDVGLRPLDRHGGERTVRAERGKADAAIGHHAGATGQFDCGDQLALDEIDHVHAGSRAEIIDIGRLAIVADDEIILARPDQQAAGHGDFGDEVERLAVIDGDHVLPRAAIALGPDGFGDIIIAARRVDRHVGQAAGFDHALHLAGFAVEYTGAGHVPAAIDEEPCRLGRVDGQRVAGFRLDRRGRIRRCGGMGRNGGA